MFIFCMQYGFPQSNVKNMFPKISKQILKSQLRMDENEAKGQGMMAEADGVVHSEVTR